MPRFIAFLRAINVGGHNVTMEALRGHFVDLGFAEVETFIASGNVIFTSSAKDIHTLQQQIEGHLHEALGYEVKTFVRTEAEVVAITQCRPFSEQRLQFAAALNIAFLTEPLDAAAKQTLARLKTDIDDFHVHGREVYWLCDKKQSESKFSNAVFEKTLKVRATFRGIKTLVRLAEKCVRTPCVIATK